MAVKPTSKKKQSRAQAREAALAAAAGVTVPASCDVMVCGGGASGLAAAIAAAEKGLSTVVLERDLECGRTILATGNGRCNFANTRLESWRYNHPEFVEKACGDAWLDDILAFFEDSGLAWAEEDTRLYPLSGQAASVRAVLLRRAARAGVVLACAREVERVEASDGGTWRVMYRESFGGETRRGLLAGSVVLAGGGRAALAEGTGLECLPGQPVLCALACHPNSAIDLAFIDGRRVRCEARLVRSGDTIHVECGEVLFRPWGLSGIVIFDLSRRAQAGDEIHLDLLASFDDGRLARAAAARCAEGLLDPVICEGLARAGANPVAAARDLAFIVDGTAEEQRAQVTRGGIDCSQVDPATLAVTGHPGLFACGEALDIDADCGGFNLAWAWKSGLVAGVAAAAHAQRQKEKGAPC